MDAGVDLGINYPFPVISTEESTTRLSYACEVIARSCPDPPKYRREPYYPPSDPRLAPDPRYSAAQHEIMRRSSASPEADCFQHGSDRVRAPVGTAWDAVRNTGAPMAVRGPYSLTHTTTAHLPTLRSPEGAAGTSPKLSSATAMAPP